jgi:hypothetical protein
MFQQIAGLNNKLEKDVPIVYRYRTCNNNLASLDPASQYQRQKIIQNTVRVASSLYTMNLGALNVYERPNLTYKLVDISGSTYVVSPGVNWNQMSDRREPHVQVVKTGTGNGYHSSSTRRTITGPRPGAMSPGGAGVDIKHNSYDRYLNRLKGKAPLRRGVVPPNFGVPYIPFSRAFPIYGGKVMKTSIVNHCNCPIDDDASSAILYRDSDIQDEILAVKFEFHVGDYVFVKQPDGESVKAQIIAINGDLYTVKFADNKIEVVNEADISIYFDCSHCVNPEDDSKYNLSPYTIDETVSLAACDLFSIIAGGLIL